MWYYIKLLLTILMLLTGIFLFTLYFCVFMFYPNLLSSKINVILNGISFLLSWLLIYLNILNLKNLYKNRGIKK